MPGRVAPAVGGSEVVRRVIHAPFVGGQVTRSHTGDDVVKGQAESVGTRECEVDRLVAEPARGAPQVEHCGVQGLALA